MKDKFLLIVLVILLSVVYWQWFLPGAKVANDLPFVSSSALKFAMNFPQAWSEFGAEGLGEYSVFTLWAWPNSFLSGLLANLGMSFLLVERFLLMIPFLILGVLGMWRFGKSLKLSGFANFIATLFYLANSYIILVLDGGQFTIGLAYAFFPISFLAIKNSIHGGMRERILAGLSIWVIGFLDIRFIYILTFLCIIYFFYESLFQKGKLSNWINAWFKTGITCVLILIALNAYWIIPILKAPLSFNAYLNLIQTDFVSFTNLGHSMLMLAPHWFKNVFGVVTPLHFEFIFITVLVFLAPILKPKDKTVGFWLVVALLFIFLAKGTSPPFGEIYKWFYMNIPGFSLFRDSTKFFFLVSLSYAALIGISVHEILRIKTLTNLKYFFIISISLYLLLLIRPAWQGVMTGTLSSQPFEKEYSNLNKLIETDGKFSRIFWIPSLPPLGQIDANHPSVEAARLAQRRIFAGGSVGTYEIFNFLREAPFMGEIFDVVGIGYIVYPYLDLRRDNMHPDNISYYYSFSDQLSKLPWLSKVDESEIPLFKVKQTQDKFFITPNVWWIIGSDNIYKESTKSADLKLSKNTLVFAEEQAGIGKRIDHVEETKIVLNNKTLTDLAASFIDSSKIIFPAKILNFDPDESGWWKRETADLLRWRDFLQTKYSIDNQDFDFGGGWAVGEGNLEFRIKNLELSKGKILLARVMESSKSGKLRFYQDDKLVGEVKTETDGQTNIRWFEVGELTKESGQLTVESSGDINVVNALAVLDQKEWNKFQSKVQSLENKIVDFNEKNAKPPQDKVSVTYTQINPTKYKVIVKNLTEPAFMVFSQSYDKLWKIDGQESLPVYSLLNGFRLDKDGVYIVEFEVQNYVYPGLIISGITLFIIILLLLKQRKPRKFRI